MFGYRSICLLVATLAGLAAIPTDISAQTPRVDLEIVMGRGFPPQNVHDWVRALEKVGADDVRIRNARSGDGIGIKNVGTDERPRYKVYGILTPENELLLKGGKFSMRELGGIRSYLERLRGEGATGMFEKKVGFGLTARELVTLHKDLSTAIAFETKGKKFEPLLREFGGAIAADIVIDRSARRGIAEGGPGLDELRGVSAGTALAALCRPLGLVVVPQKSRQGRVQLAILDSRDADEHWPIGWPLEKPPFRVAPSLLKELPVTIRDFTLDDALAAIQPRVEVPLLFDHNGLVRHGIELDKVDVELQGEMSYIAIIKRLVGQTRPSLMAEIRADEAGQPLVWISNPRD